MNERKINTQEVDPSLGAYPSDYVEGTVPLDKNGNPLDPTGTLDVRGDGNFWFHGDDVLFDQKDPRNPDLATGEVSADLDEYEEAGLTVRVLSGLGGKALKDPTAAWIEAMEAGNTEEAAKIAESF